MESLLTHLYIRSITTSCQSFFLQNSFGIHPLPSNFCYSHSLPSPYYFMSGFLDSWLASLLIGSPLFYLSCKPLPLFENLSFPVCTMRKLDWLVDLWSSYHLWHSRSEIFPKNMLPDLTIATPCAALSHLKGCYDSMLLLVPWTNLSSILFLESLSKINLKWKGFLEAGHPHWPTLTHLLSTIENTQNLVNQGVFEPFHWWEVLSQSTLCIVR